MNYSMNVAAKKLSTLALATLLSTPALAALGTSVSQVASIRIEATAAFIGLNNVLASFTCNSRVWVDLAAPEGRAAYATAMMAFNTRQTVTVRGDDAVPRMFGECKLYDIFVSQ